MESRSNVLPFTATVGSRMKSIREEFMKELKEIAIDLTQIPIGWNHKVPITDEISLEFYFLALGTMQDIITSETERLGLVKYLHKAYFREVWEDKHDITRFSHQDILFYEVNGDVFNLRILAESMFFVFSFGFGPDTKNETMDNLVLYRRKIAILGIKLYDYMSLIEDRDDYFRVQCKIMKLNFFSVGNHLRGLVYTHRA